jgi:hypothetical protein
MRDESRSKGDFGLVFARASGIMCVGGEADLRSAPERRAARVGRPVIRLAAIAALAALVGCSDPVADGRQPQASEPAPAVPASKHEPAAGMRVYVDPETGEFRPPPPDLLPQLLPDAAPDAAPPVQVIPEVPGTTRAGGVKLDLGGRFQAAVVAKSGPGGSVTTQCQPADERVTRRDP